MGTRGSSTEAEERYVAFISYRHLRRDRAWAKWLHRSLETYRTPRHLAREKSLPPRVGRVFRDEEELAASPNLSEAIERALSSSRWLIVICSPDTPDSEWVNAEVARFRELTGDRRILAMLVEGHPDESFPRALREARGAAILPCAEEEDGEAGVEPLAVDVRPSKTESSRYQRRTARLRFLATLLDCSFDDLRRRDAERRTRRMIALGGIMAGLLVLLVGMLLFALDSRDRARAQLAASLEEQGRQALASNDPRAALELLARAHEIAPEREATRLMLGHASSYFPAPLFDVPAESGEITRARFLGSDEEAITLATDGSAVLWNVTTGERVGTWRAHAGAATDVAVHPDGVRFATVGRDGMVRLWQRTAAEPLWSFPCHASDAETPAPGLSVAFGHLGRYLVTVAADGTVQVRAVEGGALRCTCVSDEEGAVSWDPSSAWFDPDGAFVVVRHESDNAIRLHAANTGNQIRNLKGRGTGLLQVIFPRPGMYMALGSLGPRSPSRHETPREGLEDSTNPFWFGGWSGLALDPHVFHVQSATLRRDRGLLVTAARDGTARLWHLRYPPASGVEVGTLAELLAAMGVDLRVLVRAASDAEIPGLRMHRMLRAAGFLGDEPEFVPAGTLEGGLGVLRTAVPDAVVSRVVTVGNDGVARLWDLSAGGGGGSPQGSGPPRLAALVTAHLGSEGKVRSAAFGPQGSAILTHHTSGRVRVWSAGPHPRTPRSFALENGERFVAWHPKGERVLTLAPTGLRWRDPDSGEVTEEIPVEVPAQGAVLLSPDAASTLIQGPETWTLIRLDSGESHALEGPAAPSRFVPKETGSAAFHPTEPIVVTTTMEVLSFWDTETGEALHHRRTRHLGGVRMLCFSGDGRTLLTVPEPLPETLSTWGKHRGLEQHEPDRLRQLLRSSRSRVTTPRLWDASTGELLASQTHHRAAVVQAVISRSGRVATVDASGCAIVWDVDTASTPWVLPERGTAPTLAAFSPFGDVLMACDAQGALALWRIDERRRVATIPAESVHLTGAGFHPQGAFVVTAGQGGEAAVWDPVSGRRLLRFPSLGAEHRSAWLSPNGRRLATVDDGQILRIWQMQRAGEE